MTESKQRPTLIDQLIGRQILLLAALLLVVGVSQYVILRQVLFSSTANSLHAEIAVLAPIMRHTLDVRGVSGFHHIASILVSRLKAPGVEVVITDSLGHVIGSSSTLHAKVPPLYNTPYFIWNHRVVVDSVIGSFYYPSGYVWLLSSVKPIHGILRRDAELYAFLACLSLIAAGSLGSLSVRRALRPLQQIRESTQRIASGEFGHATEFESAPAELHDLGESINRMSQSIQSLFAQEKNLSDQMRQFVADASHELRTPLTAINGFLDLMSRGELTLDERERGLNAIRVQGKRMGRLVSQLLTLSRMDTAPQSQLSITALALDNWIQGLSSDIHNLVAPRPVSLDLSPVTAAADPDRMTEVLFNLLDNIQRYTPNDTAVRVHVGPAGDHVLLQVDDTGPGIPASDLPHIFDRFYRGDRARTSGSGGSGLGLSIAQAIVEAQSGTICAEHLTPHGMRFRVLLPRP